MSGSAGMDELYQTYFDRTSVLMNATDRSSNAIIKANFEIGQMVADLQCRAEYGEKTVINMAVDLTKQKGYTVHPQRLWECARVYRAFEGNIGKVFELEKSIGIKITWSFLVRKCTKNPTNDNSGEAETTTFWEQKITTWENVIGEIDSVISNKEEFISNVPESVKVQIEGFISKVEGQTANNSTIIESDNKLKSLFHKVDVLLDEILKKEVVVDDETKRFLQNIEQKIKDILCEQCPN